MADDDNIIDLKPVKTGRKLTPEQKERWHASVGKSNNKPASGKPASGIPAMGEGWGGPARGDRAIAGPSALIPGQSADKRARSRARDRSREDLAADMLDKIVDIVEDPATPVGLVVIGAEKVIHMIVGKPATQNGINGDDADDADDPIDNKITIHFVDAKP